VSTRTEDLIAGVSAQRSADAHQRGNAYNGLVRTLAHGGRVPNAGEASSIMSGAGITPDRLALDVSKAQDMARRLEAIRDLPARALSSAETSAAVLVTSARLKASRDRLEREAREARAAHQVAHSALVDARRDLVELLGGYGKLQRHALGRRVLAADQALTGHLYRISRALAVAGAGSDGAAIELDPSEGVPAEGIVELQRQAGELAGELSSAIAEVEKLEHVDWSTGGVRIEDAPPRLAQVAAFGGPGMQS